MKRIFALALGMVMTISCILGTAATASAADAGVMASFTLSDYSAVLKAGTKSGEVRISYDVTSSKPADSVGVSSIVIYRSGGSRVATITGTTANNLVCAPGSSNMGTYSYIGISGTSYYAEVTVFATIGSVTDSRTVTTATVKAP